MQSLPRLSNDPYNNWKMYWTRWSDSSASASVNRPELLDLLCLANETIEELENSNEPHSVDSGTAFFACFIRS